MLSDDDIRALRDDAAKLRTFVGPWLGDGQHANVNGYALADRIERLLAEVERLRGALDALGVAIADAGYTWTPEMRTAYEGAANQDGGEK